MNDQNWPDWMNYTHRFMAGVCGVSRNDTETCRDIVAAMEAGAMSREQVMEAIGLRRAYATWAETHPL